ncbi:hypothetical protein MnTg02_01071 [bacterium MnTg02]|nr:hypothetical protein MnTg02_01071 [bacterium MnTg02]
MSDLLFHYHRNDHEFTVQLAAALEAKGFHVADLHQDGSNEPLQALTIEDLQAANCIIILWSESAANDPIFNGVADLAQQTTQLVFVSLDGTRPSAKLNWSEDYSLADLSLGTSSTDNPEFLKLCWDLTEIIGSVKADEAGPPESEIEEDSDVPAGNGSPAPESGRNGPDLPDPLAGTEMITAAPMNPALGSGELAGLLSAYTSPPKPSPPDVVEIQKKSYSSNIKDASKLVTPSKQIATDSSPTRDVAMLSTTSELEIPDLLGTRRLPSINEEMREAKTNQVADAGERIGASAKPRGVGASSDRPRTAPQGFGASRRQPLNAADSPREPYKAEPDPATPTASQYPDDEKASASRSRLPALGLMIVLGGLAATGWFFGRQLLALLSDVFGSFLFFKGAILAGAGADPTVPIADGDDVDCTVFAPPAAPPGATVLVQVFLHIPEQSQRAQQLATTFDDTAKPRMFQSLDLKIKRGAKVDVFLDCQDLHVEMRSQQLTWRGRPEACNFLVTFPDVQSARDFFPVIQLSLDGTPIGRIQFKLSAVPQLATNTINVAPCGEKAGRYRYAFLSYASKDRKEVLKRAQSLRATNIDFFQDILSLDPGDRWENKLYSQIDRCDLFLLFWSKAAAESEWVLKEIEYALDKRRASGENVPDIKPIVLETPPPLPPSHLESGLGEYHLDDYLSYIISALPSGETTDQSQDQTE